MRTETSPAHRGTIEEVVRRLARSPNVCDQRKARDIRQLRAFAHGPWKGRFELLEFASTEDRRLALLCRLRVAGLVCEPGQSGPGPNDSWTLAIELSSHYPLAQPAVRFLRPVPYNSHVVHADFPPAGELPPELQSFLREGHGGCCFLQKGQWSTAAATHNLAVVAWQISRILSLHKTLAERNSLNQAARDDALRMAAAGKTPLGDPLLCPLAGGTERAEPANDAAPEDGAADMEWIEPDDRQEEPDGRAHVPVAGG